MASASSAPPTPPGAAAAADQQRYENPINLKVMRLCKPGFFFRLPVPFQPGEQGASSLREDDYGLSGTLTLPQSFGDIYLGETFSCYISLCNVAPIELSHVGLKIEVQTQLQREILADSPVP